jgi:hypothetical protein
MVKSSVEYYTLCQSHRSLPTVDKKLPFSTGEVLTRGPFPALHRSQPARVHSLARRTFRSLRNFDTECSKISETEEESLNIMRNSMKVVSDRSSCASSSDEEASLCSIDDKLDDEKS